MSQFYFLLWMYLSEWQNDREEWRERKIKNHPSAVQFTSGWNGRSWAKLKPGTESFIQVFVTHGWRGTSHLYCLPLPLHVHYQGARQKTEQPKLKLTFWNGMPRSQQHCILFVPFFCPSLGISLSSHSMFVSGSHSYFNAFLVSVYYRPSVN